MKQAKAHLMLVLTPLKTMCNSASKAYPKKKVGPWICCKNGEKSEGREKGKRQKFTSFLTKSVDINDFTSNSYQYLLNHTPTIQEPMEDTTWEQRIQAITHLLTSPTQTPSLHSQFFISNQVPCYLKWNYPPILCKNGDNLLLLQWGISLFLKRVSRLGFPETSWRSKCPFQQPPPLILAKGVEPAPLQCGDEQMRVYFRKRLRRKRLGNDVNPLIPFLVPNFLLFALLLVDPFPVEE